MIRETLSKIYFYNNHPDHNYNFEYKTAIYDLAELRFKETIKIDNNHLRNFVLRFWEMTQLKVQFHKTTFESHKDKQNGVIDWSDIHFLPYSSFVGTKFISTLFENIKFDWCFLDGALFDRTR